METVQAAAPDRTRPAPITTGWWARNERKAIPYLFLAPFLLIFLIFTVYPMIDSFVMSLHNIESLDAAEFVGFDNYVRLLTRDARFGKSLVNATVFAVATVFLQLPLALGLALALNSTRLKFRNLARMAYFMPYITSAVVVGMLFQLVFEERYGILNGFLGTFGIQAIPWLRSADWAMPSLILVGLWIWVGSNSLYFLAGLQTIPDELKEAARIDGANEWAVFWNVTFPLLRPVTIFVITLGIIGSFSLFAQPFLLFGGGGGPRDAALMPVVYLYTRGFNDFKLGYAAAVGYVLTIIIVLVTIVQLALFRVWREN